MAFSEVSRTVKGLAILLLIASSVAHAQRCGVGAARQVKAASLRRAGMAVLSTIRQKHPEMLLRHVESSGVVFGPDKTPLARAELRIQFAHKEGAYCLFFSTQCIPDMGRFKGLEPYPALSEWKISYVDWLEANKTYSVSADLTDDAGINWCNGEFYSGTREQMKNAPNDIELDFTLYRGRWWLVATVDGVP